MSSNHAHNPELIRNALFARCKLYWGAALIIKLLVFVFGILVVFTKFEAKAVALVGLTLAALSEFLQWKSDRWKSAANGLHRKLDFENSFGWRLSESEIMDYLARYPGELTKLAGASTGSYFASNESPGPRRAIENLRESSWWSMHLAESMWWIFISTIILVIVGCIILLNASLEDFSHQLIPQHVVSANVVKIVTSAVLFIFTYGLFRFATGYFAFSNKSRQIRDSAERFLQSGSQDETKAIKLWQDYHLAREAAPIIPTWIWKIREKKLNALWNCYAGQGRV